MGTGRLEAFSDGVLAIIITIMVLELRVPDGPTWHALGDTTTGLVTYLLSFVYIGIYWSNHHHMLQLCDRVSGGVLWANLHLLFWLSLFPLTTRWMDEYDVARVPVVVYGANLLAAAIAYFVLQQTIVALEGPESRLRKAVGRDGKGKLSPVIYVLGIAAAYVTPWLGVALFTVVALIWLVPDRRLERFVAQIEDDRTR
ncbi:MAG TPA: TMEM175 family protein [Marmoricola sp.]|nr:TMEM175 family protein [Marmoricola sp.]